MKVKGHHGAFNSGEGKQIGMLERSQKERKRVRCWGVSLKNDPSSWLLGRREEKGFFKKERILFKTIAENFENLRRRRTHSKNGWMIELGPGFEPRFMTQFQTSLATFEFDLVDLIFLKEKLLKEKLALIEIRGGSKFNFREARERDESLNLKIYIENQVDKPERERLLLDRPQPNAMHQTQS